MNSVEEVLIHVKQVLIEEPFKVRVRKVGEALRHNSGNLMKVVLKATE